MFDFFTENDSLRSSGAFSLPFSKGTTNTKMDASTFEKLVRTSITEAKIECDIDETIKKFQTKQKILIDMAKLGKDKYIDAFMEENNIGSKFQRGEVVTTMVKAHQVTKESSKSPGMFLYVILCKDISETKN